MMIGRREALITLFLILLASIFLSFSPDVGGISENLRQLSEIIRVVFARGEPNLVYIKVRVLRADMGLSPSFTGNETEYELKPVKGALVAIGDYPPTISAGHLRIPRNYGFTGNDGTVILRAPVGNVTLMLAENPNYLRETDFWKTEIKVERHKSFTIKIFLYRLKPLKIKLKEGVFKLKTPVSLEFKLPENGKYYLGLPTISYYNLWWRLKLYREDLRSSLTIDDPGESYNMVRMIYTDMYQGGTIIDSFAEIREPTAYIIPSMSYLPVERISMEEEMP